MATEINPKAVETYTKVAQTVDPYVPKVAKDTLSYVVSSAEPYVPHTVKSVASTAAIHTVNTVTYAAEGAAATAAAAGKSVSDTVTATREYAANKYTQASEGVTKIVSGATTTIVSYTPSPIVSLVSSAADTARAVREDPVGSLKAYVPTFVIQSGEKSYEIVQHTVEQAKDNASKATGYIVTKVNGTVHAIAEHPQIHTLVEQVQKLAENIPIVNRYTGKANGEAKEAAAEEKTQ